jgi:hypothetical protein
VAWGYRRKYSDCYESVCVLMGMVGESRNGIKCCTCLRSLYLYFPDTPSNKANVRHKFRRMMF